MPARLYLKKETEGACKQVRIFFHDSPPPKKSNQMKAREDNKRLGKKTKRKEVSGEGKREKKEERGKLVETNIYINKIREDFKRYQLGGGRIRSHKGIYTPACKTKRAFNT